MSKNLKFFGVLAIAVLLALAIPFTCRQQQTETKGETPQTPFGKPGDTMVRMLPYKLKPTASTAKAFASKRNSVKRFIEKNWRNPNESLSFLVAQDGQIVYEHYQGVANKRKGIDIARNTPLHIASVSKVLTATAILELIHAGKITLDQKVNSILTGFPYPEITVKTLLNHRSGLRNYAYYLDVKGIWDKRKAITNQEIFDLYVKNDVALDFPTDKRFAYCNTNYAFLALIIEKCTGLTYPDAMSEMIFKPLGMTDTFVYDHQTDREKINPSYFASGMEIALDHLDAVYGDKNIYSTPRDLLKFDMARYSPDYLTPELKKQVYVGYSFEQRGEKNYGLGIRMIDWVTGQHFYFHNGWWHGNTSAYVNLKKEKVTIIALSNRYSKKPYRVKLLAKLFGDYPFQMGKEDELE